MRSLIVWTVMASACGTRFITPPTVPPGEARVEAREMPPNPETEPLPEGIPSDMRVEPVEVGNMVPFPGVLVGEGKAAKFAQYNIRYKELRSNYEADRKVWAAHRELYETRLKLADKAIYDLQPTWWERNAYSLGVISGLALGVTMAIAGFALAQ